MRGKRYRLIIAMLIMMLIISGCTRVSRSGIIKAQKNSNMLLPSITYKYDNYATFGQMSAVHEGYLYYCGDNEEGKGIYKQDLLTKKESLIIDVESVRRIQVTEEGIYYIGRTPDKDIEENNSDGKWNTYQLLFHEGHEKTDIQDKGLTDELFAWNFYATSKYIFSTKIQFVIPRGVGVIKASIYQKGDGMPISWDEKRLIINPTTSEIALYQYDDLLVFAEYLARDEELNSALSAYGNGVESVIYTSTDRGYRMSPEPHMLLGKWKEDYIWSKSGKVFLENSKEVIKETQIEGMVLAKFGFQEEDIIYIIAGMGDTESFEKWRYPETSESIYKLNVNTLAAEELKVLGENERTIAMTEKGFICVSDEKVIVRDKQNGIIVLEQSLEKPMDWEKNSVEIAGDYVFIYDYEEGINIRERIEIEW